MKIYAACLASYNAGTLFGEWITIDDMSGDDISAAIAAMLARSPSADAEEWAIHDYDDEYGALKGFGESPDLEKLADVALAVSEVEASHDAGSVKVLIGWAADAGAEPCDWASTIDEAYAGETTPEDYAAEMIEGRGDIPAHLENYIDYRAMARDMALGGEVDFICPTTGSYLQDHDSMGRDAIVMRCN